MRGLVSLLDQFAVDHYHQTALHLEALRVRLGRDGLDMNEWNALIHAASFLTVEATRRTKEMPE